MRKEKIGLSYRLLHIFTYHPWLKLISLILAALVWIFVKGEISRFNY